MATEAEIKALEAKELLDEKNKDYRTDFLATPLYTAGDISHFDLPKAMRPEIPYLDKAVQSGKGIFNALVGKRFKIPFNVLANLPEGVRSIKNLMMPEADTGLGFTMKMSDKGATTGGNITKKVVSKVEELKNKQKLLKEAYKDKEVLKLNKILPNFAKLTDDEKYEAAVSFVNVLDSPTKKFALYDILKKTEKTTKKPTSIDSVYAYANRNNMIPEGLMGKSSKETVQFEPKAMKSNQEIIDVFNNLKKWKSSKEGKLDLTGRSLSGTKLDEVMNIGELTPKKRQDIIKILRSDLDNIGLTDVSRPGKIKIPKNKSAQKLLEEMGLTTFPRDFQFATSGLLTTPQKIQYNKLIAALDSSAQAKGLKVGAGTDFGTKNIGNRMLRQAFQNDIPLTEVFKKLEKVDIDGVADIIKRRNAYNNKIQEFIQLGYDVDKAEIGHITAIAEDALLALDLDNLVLQSAKANRRETGLRNKIKNILNNPEKSPYKMEEVIKELEDLGIETKVGDNIYGKAKDIEKELRNLEIGASDAIFGIPYSEGGIVGINHLTRPLGNF
tara:strand:- start:49 stop:1710 length:1662 start_codon:yes stop_codon:yes gene_type:complete